MSCRCGKGKEEKAKSGKKHHLAKLLLLGIAAAAGYSWYSQLDESKKRFIKHLLRQVPYLPGRYYA